MNEAGQGKPGATSDATARAEFGDRVNPPNPESAVPIGVDLGRLGAWIESWTSIHGPFTVETMSAGRSNLTLALTDATGTEYVIRRPPLGILVPGAHDVIREASILGGLARSTLPVPSVIAVCEDDEVIGAPFFMMSKMPGRPFNIETATSLSTSARHAVGLGMISVLTRIHAVDVDRCGLGDLRRRRPFIERQLRSWGRQIERLDGPLARRLNALETALGKAYPAEQSVCLLHGDYKADNVLIDEQGAICGVVDWELSAIGDPLSDLAWLLIWWAEDTAELPWLARPATSAGGFASSATLIDRYAAESGLVVDDLDYYLALAYWRLCVINAGTRRRFLGGEMGDKVIDLALLESQIEWQSDAARVSLATWHRRPGTTSSRLGSHARRPETR